MALVLADRVQQTGTANTTVSFTLSGSVTGFQSFAVVGNTNTTYYSATDASGNWEVGIGTYSTTGPTLTRTTILSSSNSGSAVTFSGTVAVLLTYPSSYSVRAAASGSNSEFVSSTALLFYQATAPTGWTKSTTNNDKALRVVSGATGGSAGGSVAFTTAFASQAVTGSVAATGSTTAGGTVGTSGSTTASGTVGNTTLSLSQIPSHAHYVRGVARPDSVGIRFGDMGGGSTNMCPSGDPVNSDTYTGGLYGWYEGGDGSHNHTFTGDAHNHAGGTFTGTSHNHTSGAFTGTAINLAVQYVDVIICTKD